MSEATRAVQGVPEVLQQERPETTGKTPLQTHSGYDKVMCVVMGSVCVSGIQNTEVSSEVG